jgi:3-oxo-5-alpha-steroid 4-dehydrogenase 1
MPEPRFYDPLIIAWFVLAAPTFLTLIFIPAPYGRHVRRGWGPVLEAKFGWLIMEAPAALVLAATFIFGRQPKSLCAYAFLALWEMHYIHRAFVYPFRIRSAGKRMPLIIVGIGTFFNVANSTWIGITLFTLSELYRNAWLLTPQFTIGSAIFLIGYAINRVADRILRNLRSTGDIHYSIPHGSLYKWVSCPNYLGESIQWIGWAVATWSLSGLAFAVWTIANLAPRARSHHLWYQARFVDYPVKRKALVPYLW